MIFKTERRTFVGKDADQSLSEYLTEASDANDYCWELHPSTTMVWVTNGVSIIAVWQRQSFGEVLA